MIQPRRLIILAATLAAACVTAISLCEHSRRTSPILDADSEALGRAQPYAFEAQRNASESATRTELPNASDEHLGDESSPTLDLGEAHPIARRTGRPLSSGERGPVVDELEGKAAIAKEKFDRLSAQHTFQDDLSQLSHYAEVLLAQRDYLIQKYAAEHVRKGGGRVVRIDTRFQDMLQRARPRPDWFYTSHSTTNKKEAGILVVLPKKMSDIEEAEKAYMEARRVRVGILADRFNERTAARRQQQIRRFKENRQPSDLGLSFEELLYVKIDSETFELRMKRQ